MSTRYGVKYKNADFGFTGGITEHYRLAAAYANAHGGSVYEVGSRDDPEQLSLRHRLAMQGVDTEAIALAVKHARATTKHIEAQEEDFSDLC